MTPQELQDIGRRMFRTIPNHWTDALAGVLGVSPRAVQRWANGQNPIPDKIAKNVLKLDRIAEAGRVEADRRRFKGEF